MRPLSWPCVWQDCTAVCFAIVHKESRVSAHLATNTPTPLFALVMDHEAQFKCTFIDCPYGSNGPKFFKRHTYLAQHLKNVHEEKLFKCTACDQRFAVEWQLSYHVKYCGTELKCTTCLKSYAKPMSLVMHCKRTSHPLPSDKQFKFRNLNFGTKSGHSLPTYIFVPILVAKPIWKNKPILPKTAPTDSTASVEVLQTVISPSKCTKKRSHAASEETGTKSKRSTDCQTVRKRNRASYKHDSKSIQTQTMHSSFDAIAVQPNLSAPSSVSKKCSSFTQTLLEQPLSNDDFIGRDSFLPDEMVQLEQAAQTDFEFENCNTTETQTITDFEGGEDLSISNRDDQFQFSDLEFIDIETQTIWNYDRTTQTENFGTGFDNWMNDDY